MTVGPEWKEILLFSFPIMAGQFLQQLYNTVDSIVVSRYGGPTQEISNAMFAAVGSCTSLIFLFLAISLGLANGGGVLVSQLYGARREHELRRAASTLLITQASLGTALAVLGSLGAELLVVGLMRVTDEASRAYAVEYFAIYAVGLIFQYIYNAVAGILRAVGDSRASMYFLCVSAVLNTVLDLWFVISFGWGVVGVAVATVIAQAASATVSIVYMMRRYPIFRFRRSEFVFDTEKFRICLKLGIPAIIQQAVVSMGNVFIQRLVNSFGQVTMSAFNAGNRMESYALIPIFGTNMAVAGGGVSALDELLHHPFRRVYAHLGPPSGRGRRAVDLHDQLLHPRAPRDCGLYHGLRARRRLRGLLAEHPLRLDAGHTAKLPEILLQALDDQARGARPHPRGRGRGGESV